MLYVYTCMSNFTLWSIPSTYLKTSVVCIGFYPHAVVCIPSAAPLGNTYNCTRVQIQYTLDGVIIYHSTINTCMSSSFYNNTHRLPAVWSSGSSPVRGHWGCCVSWWGSPDTCTGNSWCLRAILAYWMMALAEWCTINIAWLLCARERQIVNLIIN